LIARTAGAEPEPALVDEVYRRTGGNPFFVEQTARLWRADGSISGIAPSVSAAVGRRLSLLPRLVVEVLTVAAVLGREFHRQVLAACATAPVAEVDRLLDAAIAARLVVARGGGAFAFAHDLVRETLYGELDEAQRRRRHAAVIHAVDPAGTVANRLPPTDLARHAYLAGGDLEPGRAVDLLVAAARDASARLATEESAAHYRRALEVVDDPKRRALIALELGSERHHHGDHEEGWRHIDDAARIARELDEPELLGRVAVTAYRHTGPRSSRVQAVADLVREAHARAVGDAGPAGEAPLDRLVVDLIEGSERSARHGRDDEALTFSLWARHDTMWGLGTAREREALTREMAEVARRSGDRDSELFAAALRWVALVEQGDPRYLDQLHTFVAMGERADVPRYHIATKIDGAIIAGFRGEFDQADALLDDALSHSDRDHPDFAFMSQHLRWARLALQGRFDEMEAVLDPLGKPEHPYVELVRAITAVERGDADPAVRHIADIEATGPPYPGFMTPLWLRLRAQAAAATRDPAACEEIRTVLAPHRDEWLVSMYGCDISGPVSLWIAAVDAAQGRWGDAVAGFTAARESADRLHARPWGVIAGAGLAEALAGRAAPGDAAAAETVRAEVEQEAGRLGMGQVLARLHAGTDIVPPPAPPSAAEFRREGAVWRLGYAGVVVHLPDAKGLRDLHLLLSQPGVDIPAIHLLDPAAGPQLVAARQMGGDPILDDEAKASYRRRLVALDEAIDRAAARGDDRRETALEAERKALLDELRAAAGLAGRSRRLGDEAERARKTVTARIRDTLRRLDERHPALAAHLRDAVSTGSTCRYTPSEPVAWRLH
ncbi:MAG TPA: ATPase, partial [Pilimelia sp.]|nr:ATPase [Pilimelia sp.]